MGNRAARKNFASPLFFGAQKTFSNLQGVPKTFVSDQGRASFLCEAKQKIEKKLGDIRSRPNDQPVGFCLPQRSAKRLWLFGFTINVDPEQGSRWSIFGGQINSRFEISAYSV